MLEMMVYRSFLDISFISFTPLFGLVKNAWLADMEMC